MEQIKKCVAQVIKEPVEQICGDGKLRTVYSKSNTYGLDMETGIVRASLSQKVLGRIIKVKEIR
ncbi:MAG: hypothetical protein NC218_03270 [Acetobacter sp.]|nr:hypothetical protein [Acetobacter sp.]